MYRIGVVDYLNTKPLTWAAERGLVEGLEAVCDVPSRLARQLRAGRLDAAIVSSVLALDGEALTLLPTAGCLAADGEVRSVLLFCRRPLARVRRVALDTSSLTSVELTRILLQLRHGLRPEYLPREPNLPAMLADCDAALLIGDPGLAQHARGPGTQPVVETIDLGLAWREWTGLPFVFAAWVAAAGRDTTELADLLALSRRLSSERLETIVAEQAARLGLAAAVVREYLTRVIRYDLGERELAGLTRFAELRRELRASEERES